MKNRAKNNRNSGLTLVETLVTVAIIVILMGVSAVAVVHYIDNLKLTELDNAAREIYMAAQNRAVLLAGNQQLIDLVYTADANGNKTGGVGTPVKLAGPHSAGDAGDNGDTSDGPEVISLLATADGDNNDEDENVGEDLYYVHVSDVQAELLLDSNIDPSLLNEGDFYIVYERTSGSVTDVIYAEKKNKKNEEKAPLKELVIETALKDFPDLPEEAESESLAFASLYNTWWSDDYSKRVEKKPLVGHYYGAPAERSAQLGSPDGQPLIDVDIINGEELIVTLTVYYGEKNNVTDEKVIAAVEKAIRNAGTENGMHVWLSAENATPSDGIDLAVILAGARKRIERDGFYKDPAAGEAFYSCTWVLDSLRDSAAPANSAQVLKFKELSANGKDVISVVRPGENFRVTAIIPKDSASGLRERSDFDDDNSLFAYNNGQGGGTTAYIACLRHLQNLDTTNYNSGAVGITDAVQTANIFGGGNEYLAGTTTRIYENYEFYPISNNALKSYSGYDGNQEGTALRGYEIRNLKVRTSGSDSSFGFFSRTRPEGMDFNNIRLVNTEVKSSASNAFVGALAGQTFGNTKITNCWVYWEAGEGVNDLKEKLGTDESGKYNYQLTGGVVGGLVGVSNGKIEIRQSLAAAMIDGSTAAGGLVGRMMVSERNLIEKSYADCYLTGSAQAAGLVGDLNTSDTSVELNYCYSAGYIEIRETGLKAAGLCLGSGKTEADNVYTAMRYLNAQLGNINDSSLDSNVFYLTENQLQGDEFSKTYYWGNDKTISGAVGADYDEMTDSSDSGFASKLNNGSAKNFVWDPNTHAYNLRKYLALTTYSFPGLAGLDHYGDWGAKFKNPSLVYYEHYDYEHYDAAGDNDWGISGGNARNLLPSTLKSGTVLSDGYAIAFLTDTVSGADKVAIQYTYLNEGKAKTGIFTGTSLEWKARLTQWEDEDKPDNEQTAYLIPLPDELVYNSYAQESFYHYFKFEMYVGVALTTDGKIPENATLAASGEYFFNPHFAEAIQPYTGEIANPSKWIDEPDNSMTDAAEKLAGSMGAIGIRTPRHLYDLSQFETYYNNETKRYAFRQWLDLDYATYDWKGFNGGASIFGLTDSTGADLPNTSPYIQNPIGIAGSAFTGSYDGNYCTIKNVIPNTGALNSGNGYAGLFGNFRGTKLENIVYQMGPDVYMDTAEDMSEVNYAPYRLSVENDSISGGMYIGGLVGFSNGTINNCAVYGMDASVKVSGINVYVGGLVGRNEGTITNCSAETNGIAIDGSSYARIYAGGFAGENYSSGSISYAYSVGRIAAFSVDSQVSRICGFVGSNSGVIANAYAAMDLEPSGDAKAYGFSENDADDPNLGGNVGYLDQGSYTYRKDSYAANYKPVADDSGYSAKSYTYAQLSGTEKNNNFDRTGMSLEKPVSPQGISPQGNENNGNNEDNENCYPFPAVVKNADGDGYIHYGLWTTRMALGEMGVYYWEKLMDVVPGEGGMNTTTGDGTYHIYALAVDPGKDGENGTITLQDTLSYAYNDGKAVVAYGYGYYYQKDKPEPKFNAKDIGYFRYVNGNKGRSGETIDGIGGDNIVYPLSYENSNWGITVEQIEADNKNGPTENVTYKKTIESNKRLGGILGDDYEFVSWDTYHEGGRSVTWGTPGASDYDPRLPESTAGITPISSWKPDEGGTFILTQGNGADNMVVEFTINPQFAASLSVKSVKKGSNNNDIIDDWNTNGLTVPPGTSAKPYQIRAGMQLQDINWYNSIYTDSVFGSVNNGKGDAGIFPYLSDNTHERYFYWKQTHDMDWTAEGNTYFDDGKGETEPGVFFPIGLVTVDSNTLPGWFAGRYNGDNYTIKNFNIGVNSRDYEPNCIGLFGAIKTNENDPDTVLENIVMYSEGGENTIVVRGRNSSERAVDATDNNQLWWYAGGALVGYAEESTISGCVVAGYTIEDQTEYARYNGGSWKIYYNNQFYPIYTDYTGAGTPLGTGDLHGSRAAWTVSKGNPANEYSRTARPSERTGGHSFSSYYYTNIGGDYYLFILRNDSDVVTLYKRNGSLALWYWNGGTVSATVMRGPMTYDMGGAIGGLVGIANNTPLDGCVAVVDINLASEHYDEEEDKHDGRSAPIRVGGLVGTTTASVSNCYTGGTIDESGASYSTLYIGRIIGGVGAGPFGDNTGPIKVSTCYSYMEDIPSSEESVPVTRYNIGGQGGNNVTPELTDNYYLGNDIREDTVTAEPEGSKYASYQQLAGKVSLNGAELQSRFNDIYGKLTKFKPVTSYTESGLSITGRYTFVPASETGLQGLDYPFPAILKQDGNYVHYGKWNLFGIERYSKNAKSGNGKNATFNKDDVQGGKPVELDLFTSKEEDEGAGLRLQYLKLTDEVTDGGTWEVTTSNVKALQASFDGIKFTEENDDTESSEENDGTEYTEENKEEVTIDDEYGWTSLYLKAVAPSETPITVTVTYREPDEKDKEGNVLVKGDVYTLKIIVHVTSVVELEPTVLSMFPNDIVEISLTPRSGKGSVELVRDTAVSINNSYVRARVYNGMLELTTNGFENVPDEDKRAYVEVDYVYTLDGRTMEDTKRITVNLLELPQAGTWEEVQGEDGTWTWIWTIDLSGYEGAEIIKDLKDDESSAPIGIGKVEVGDVSKNDYKIRLTKNSDFISDAVPKNIIAITRESQMSEGLEPVEITHKLNFTVPKPVTEADLKLNITQNKKDGGGGTDSWTIDFGSYEVSQDIQVTAESGNVTAERSSDGTAVTLKSNNNTDFPESVELNLTLTDSNSNLREVILLTIVLPELTAELDTMTDVDENTLYCWIIDLNRYNDSDSNRLDENSVVVKIQEGYDAKYSKESNSVIITKKDSGNADSAEGGNGAEGPKSIELTVTLTTINEGPIETCALTVDLPVPEANFEGIGLSMFSNDEVTLSIEALTTDRTNAGTTGLKIKKAASSNENVEATPDNDGKSVTIVSHGASGAASVDLMYTYDDETVAGFQRIEVGLLPLPEHLWTRDEDGTWTWTMNFGDEYGDSVDGFRISEVDIAENDNLSDDEVIKAEVNGSRIILTLAENSEDKFPEEGVKLNVTATLDDETHILTITVPKPLIESEMTLLVDKSEDEWMIRFEGCEVKKAWIVGEVEETRAVSEDEPEYSDDSDGYATIADGCVTITSDGIGDSVTLHVILANGYLQQEFDLTVALPKLWALPGGQNEDRDEEQDEDENSFYSWSINLSDSAEILQYINVTIPEGSEGFEIGNMTPEGSMSVSSGDMGDADGADETDSKIYYCTLTYYNSAEADIPEEIKLNVTLKTENGLTEKCTLTVKLPSYDDTVSDGDLNNADGGELNSAVSGELNSSVSGNLNSTVSGNRNSAVGGDRNSASGGDHNSVSSGDPGDSAIYAPDDFRTLDAEESK